MQPDQIERKKYLSQTIDFNYKMLVSACKFMTLYLLKKYNPTQFLFEDPLERQYRVKLGDKIQCNCHEGNLGHCIHSLYILIRIFKLPENHPFVFQNSYSSSDLQTLTQMGKSTKQINIKSKSENSSTIQINMQTEKIKQQIRMLTLSNSSKVVQISHIENKEQETWPVFEEDTVCPICYDQIQNQTPIIDCQNCRNYFHTKCLKVWITQKQKEQSSSYSCPMCRRDFEKQIQKRIVKMDNYYVSYHQSHGINCSCCGKDILIKLYKCLLCDNVYLCNQCYKNWEHKNHDKFIGKEGKRLDWTVTERSQFNINKLNANLQYFKKFGTDKNSEFIQLMGPKYEKFLSNYIKKPTIKDHIINSLLDVQKEIHKTYKKIDFTQKDIICCACKKKKIVGMRRMSCKHFIDEKCLKFFLQNEIRQCPIDKSYIVPGLSNVKLNIQ